MVAITQKTNIDRLKDACEQYMHIEKIIPSALAVYALLKEKASAVQSATYFVLLLQENFITIIYVVHGTLKTIRTIIKKQQDFTKDLLFALNIIDSNYESVPCYYYASAPAGATSTNLNVASPNNPLTIDLSDAKLTLYELVQLLPAEFGHVDIINASIAYPSQLLNNFNLLQGEPDSYTLKKIIKASVLAVFFISITFALLSIHNYFSLRDIRRDIIKNERFIKRSIKEKFNITATNTKGLLKKLSDKVNKDESVFFAFSTKTAFSYLRYLQELSTIIDRKEVEVTVEQLTFTDKSIVMKAHVATFDDLHKLIEQLNTSTLFKKVTEPQETSFTIELLFNRGGA